MGFSFVTEIPSPDVIRERFPLAPELAARFTKTTTSRRFSIA